MTEPEQPERLATERRIIRFEPAWMTDIRAAIARIEAQRLALRDAPDIIRLADSSCQCQPGPPDQAA